MPAYRPFVTVTSSPRTADSSGVLNKQIAVAVAQWRSCGDFSEQTLLRSEETVRRFARRLFAQGVVDLRGVTRAHCQGFIDAVTSEGRPPELSTQHARRVAVRMLFRALRDTGVEVHDPSIDIHLPARSARAARPLSDDEVGLCRAATRLGVSGSASLQRAVAWALAEATAITSEISAVRVCDLDDPEQPSYVHLPGTRRTNPRLGELTDWGRAIVGRQARLLRERRVPPTALLTYRGAGAQGQSAAQAAVCNAISAVLNLAGLGDEADVRPASVRNWAGRRLYDAGMPIERVAQRLGSRSLDGVAEDIALAWRTP
jgi:integrase/recombinase XerC